jgi:hypothetical protein
MNSRSRIIMPPQAADSNSFLTTNACQGVTISLSQKAFVFVTYSRHEFDYLTPSQGWCQRLLVVWCAAEGTTRTTLLGHGIKPSPFA